MSVSIQAAIASSTAYWMSGLSTIGSNSFGIALVAGKNRVPKPATGNTALRILVVLIVDASKWMKLIRRDARKFDHV